VSNYKGAWVLWTVMIIVATTLPWSGFSAHVDQRRLYWMLWLPFYGSEWSKRWAADVVVNILLFIPFSYLYLRSQVLHRTQNIVGIILATALLSGILEWGQVFNTRRFPSMTDVANNVIGALLGVGIFLLWRAKRSPAMPPPLS
jgi:glycopeptide antibiotics resistance protein